MYDDNQIPTAEILAKMKEAYQIESVQVEVCEVSEYRQIAEIEEILALLAPQRPSFKMYVRFFANGSGSGCSHSSNSSAQLANPAPIIKAQSVVIKKLLVFMSL